MIDRVTIETRWLRELLDELHRLHTTILALAEKKIRARKPAQPRTRTAATHRSRQKPTVSKQ